MEYTSNCSRSQPRNVISFVWFRKIALREKGIREVILANYRRAKVFAYHKRKELYSVLEKMQSVGTKLH